MKRFLAFVVAAIGTVVMLLAAAYYILPEQIIDAGRWLRRQQAELSRHEVTAAGHRIAYLAGGSGEPLVLLHGFGADKDNWPPIARILTRHYRVYAPDLPGFGESTRDPAATYGLPEQAARLEAFTRAVGIHAAFHLGGNSMGGGIAGVYATRYPERLKSLWLIDPGRVRAAKRSEMETLIAARQNPMLVTTREEFDKLLAMAFANPPNLPARFRDVLARAKAAHRDFDQKIFQDLNFRAFALEDELRGSTVPTLILWGDQDRMVDVSGAGILHAAMPRSTVAILPGVGHVPMIEQPEATAAAYLEFRRPLR